MMGVDAFMKVKCNHTNEMQPCKWNEVLQNLKCSLVVVNEMKCSFGNGVQRHEWNAIFKIENAAWQNRNKFENAAIELK